MSDKPIKLAGELVVVALKAVSKITYDPVADRVLLMTKFSGTVARFTQRWGKLVALHGSLVHGPRISIWQVN